MNLIFRLLFFVFLSLSILSAAEPDAQSAKIKELSTEFWSAMTKASFEEAKKQIFTKDDDPELEKAEFFAKMAGEEFAQLVGRLKGQNEEAKLKEITVKGIQEQRGREVAFVVMMVWEPKEKEYEKLTIAWMKTKKSGWKIVDL